MNVLNGFAGRVLLVAAVSIVGMGFVTRAVAAEPAVGSRNVAIADPPVPRPSTTPCTVELFPEESIGSVGNNTRMDAIPRPFQYAPPAKCGGPWAKVVLIAKFSVDPGRQYDRTASIWIKGVNVYFGTTEEPSAKVGPHWEIQRDLTDYSKLFRTQGKGEVWVNNWLDKLRKSKIHVSAELLFYPASNRYPAPTVADDIYPLNTSTSTPANLITSKRSVTAEGSAAQTSNLPPEMKELSRNITFPSNTSRVYLDVVAQGQFRDEFYYQCLPNDLRARTTGFAARHAYTKGKPRACGGGNFREVLVTIDGTPAGLAPVTPWIYTGGIDPFLWRPTPGNETLDFVPYRVDLTPFAGVLSDGKPHRISVKVVGANNFFSVAGTVLAYRAGNVAHTGGAVTVNTLKALKLEPTVTSTLRPDSAGVPTGMVTTVAHQRYDIEGYINTPSGREDSRVEGRLRISNRQQFLAPSSEATVRHVTNQDVLLKSTSSSKGGGTKNRTLHRKVQYSLSLDIARPGPKDASGREGQKVMVRQTFDRRVSQTQAGLPLFEAHVINRHVGSDDITFERGKLASFHDTGQTSAQTFDYWNSLGDCYYSQVRARNGRVTGITHGTGCVNGKTFMHWFVHPDGSPSSFGWRGRGGDD